MEGRSKGRHLPINEKHVLNREGVGTLRWFQTGCLSSAIPRHIMTKRQQAFVGVKFRKVAVVQYWRPLADILERARLLAQAASGFPTRCPRTAELQWPSKPHPVCFGSSFRESGNPTWIPARAPLGRNDDGPANPQPGPGRWVLGHVVRSLTRNSASLSVA